MKLNLGCGKDYIKGFKNIDFNKNIKADLYFDLNKKLPFKSNSIDYIFCSHTLEHLDDPAKFLREVERILKPKHTTFIILPHWNLFGHKRDLTHKRYCTSKTFCPSTQAVSYQTNFIVKDIYWCGKWKTVLDWIPLSFLEKIRWPVYELRFTLQKEGKK